MKHPALQFNDFERTTFISLAKLWIRDVEKDATYFAVTDDAHAVERVGSLTADLHGFMCRYLARRGLSEQCMQEELFTFQDVTMHVDNVYPDAFCTLLISVRMAGTLSSYLPGSYEMDDIHYDVFEPDLPGGSIVVFDENLPHSYHAADEQRQLAVTVGVLADEFEALIKAQV